MRNNILVLGLITLVLLALNNGSGQTRQSQQAVATTPSHVRKLWERNAELDIAAANDRSIDIVISSLLHAEVVDKILSLRRSTGGVVNSAEFESLGKQNDNELEQTISAFPAGQAKTEAAAAFKFYRDAQRVIEIKNGPAQFSQPTGDAVAAQIASLHRAQIVDMIVSYNRRFGGWLAKSTGEELKWGFPEILGELDRAQRAYLEWSRSNQKVAARVSLRDGRTLLVHGIERIATRTIGDRVMSVRVNDLYVRFGETRRYVSFLAISEARFGPWKGRATKKQEEQEVSLTMRDGSIKTGTVAQPFLEEETNAFEGSVLDKSQIVMIEKVSVIKFLDMD